MNKGAAPANYYAPLRDYEVVGCAASIQCPLDARSLTDPFCLLHSRDPKTEAEVDQAIVKALATPSPKGYVNLEGIIVPHLVIPQLSVPTAVSFNGSKVAGDVMLLGTTFQSGLDLGIEIGNNLLLKNCTFMDDVHFNRTSAKGMGLSDNTFHGEAHFDGLLASQNVNITLCKFLGQTFLSHMGFATLHVWKCEFRDWFLVRALEFHGECSLSQLRVSGKSLWKDCKVFGHLSVDGCTFEGLSTIEDFTVEPGTFTLDNRNPPVPPQKPCVSFVQNLVTQPGALMIRGTPGDRKFPHQAIVTTKKDRMDLQGFRFAFTNVANIDFVYVRFHNKPGHRLVRARTADDDLVAEDPDNPEHAPPATSPYGEGLSNDTMELLYRGFRASYQRNLAYPESAQFHISEMEFRRQRIRLESQTILSRLYHRRLSVINWYRRLGMYGESYSRPLVWLAGLVFAVYAYDKWWSGVKQAWTKAVEQTHNPALLALDTVVHAIAGPLATLNTEIGVALDHLVPGRQPAGLSGVGFALVTMGVLLTALIGTGLRRSFRR